MKKLFKQAIVSMILLAGVTTVSAQTLSPVVSPSSGGFYVAGSSQLSWTMGETFYTTLNPGGTNILTQGFQQPEIQLNVGSISGSPFCQGATVTVPFTALDYLNPSNVFTAQLSSSSGSFNGPVNIGTVTGTASGSIIATIPLGTTPGTGYRIRVVSSIPTFYSSDNGVNLTVLPNVTSTVDQSICQGASYAGHTTTGTYVDHYTSAAGCDSARTLNLTVIPSSTNTITTSICSGSSYTVGTHSYNTTGTYTVTLSGAAASGCDSIVTLNLTVTNSVVPSVTNSANQTTICVAGSVIFTATPTNGGTGPSYQWFKDGTASGTNSATYTATSINNNDSVWVVMTSNSSCASPLTATSNKIRITVSSCGQTTWTGTTSTAWATGTNWTSGVPLCGVNAVIPSGRSRYPLIASGLTESVDSITIQTGASLTVTGTLDVCGGWSNSGTASVGTGTVVLQNTNPDHIYGNTSFTNLSVSGSYTVGSNTTDTISIAGILEKLSGGSLATSNKVTLLSTSTTTALIQEAGGTLTGRIWMQRYMGDSRGYHHLSSPVTDATVGDWAQYFNLTGDNGVGSFVHGLEGTLQEYLEGSNHTQNLDSGYYNYTRLTLPLTSGLGLSQMDSTIPLPKVLTTYGTPAHGSISVPVSRNAFNESNTSGWNFIGNPYPSPISWTMLKGLNPGIINGSCYIWKPTGLATGAYQTYNGTAGTNGAGDVISSSQGFWILDVQGGGTSANLTFGDTIRTTTLSAVFYKAPDQLDNEVDIAITDGTESDEIIAYTQPGASDGFDAEVDGVKPNLPALATNMSIAYKINGLPYSIHVTDNITPATVWPLEVSAAHDGIYNITPNTINVKGLPVYLLDNTSGRYYDLNKEIPALSLTGGMKDDKSYAIVFDKPGTTADNSIRIYSYGDQIYVNRTSGKSAKIRVTNLLGQEIAVLHSESNNSVINVDGLQASCVIVYVEEDGGGLKQSAKLVLFNDK